MVEFNDFVVGNYFILDQKLLIKIVEIGNDAAGNLCFSSKEICIGGIISVKAYVNISQFLCSINQAGKDLRLADSSEIAAIKKQAQKALAREIDKISKL